MRGLGKKLWWLSESPYIHNVYSYLVQLFVVLFLCVYLFTPIKWHQLKFTLIQWHQLEFYSNSTAYNLVTTCLTPTHTFSRNKYRNEKSSINTIGECQQLIIGGLSFIPFCKMHFLIFADVLFLWNIILIMFCIHRKNQSTKGTEMKDKYIILFSLSW